jgi:YfhG lipoprotein
MRMPRNARRRAADARRRVALASHWRGALGCAALALAAAGCAGLTSRTHSPAPPAVTPSAAATSALLGEYLQLMQRLVQGQPAEQAEIVASAQHDYDFAPTPSHQLKLALVLGTPGHPAANLPKAQSLLRELMANPEMLLPGERALAAVELSQIDDHLTLDAENRRLQAEAVRLDQERVASANRRVQAEVDENARLRKELEEARAKLDAIADIERQLNERKPDSAGR